MAAYIIRNWDRTRTWKPEAVYEPSGEDAIAELIRQAAESHSLVKPIGQALCWSDISDMPQNAIRFRNMSKVLEIDQEGRTVRVQAGVRLKHVNEVLALHGLAFENFGSIVLQTAAGYIATGTHGTGIRTRILSDSIENMRLIDGLGKIHELDARTEPELFAAAKVNLGCLGVVTEITFRCIEAFDLEERLELVDFDRALANLDRYLVENDYCKFWWLAYTDKVQVYTFNRTNRARGGFGLTGFMDRTGISGTAFAGLMKLGRTFPVAIPFLHNTVQKIHFHPRQRVDRSDKVIKVSGGIPRHQEMEYAIPVEDAARAIAATRELVLNADWRVNFPMEVRFVAADDIPMSPTTGRASCYIGAYVASREWAPRYFADFEELMRTYGGRPHWGKSFNLGHEEIRRLYPAYDHFNRIRQRCDPYGIFRNSFVDRVFPT